jgi:glycosyltransferase involved in cell wall biosynthesis
VLYICIPSFDEAPTVGVLLWKIRKVFQEFSREYEILVYNDASTDATAETLESYTKVLPLTILGGESRVGYARALTTLCRTATQRTRYARRDAVITLQADFTDQPEHIPELVKRFEGGADIVVAERAATAPLGPKPVQRLRRFAPWALRWSVQTPGVRDPFGSLRLYRVSVLRDAFKAAGDKPLVAGEGWAANVDLLLGTTPHARRVETVEMEPNYDLRPRETRIKPLADVMNLYRFGREARRRPQPAPPPPAV